MPIAPGTKIGPYEIQAPLGEGGMGAVYKAHDPTLQRTVAIKVLAKQDEDASARLLQEARAASALNHPHICTIHEVGEHEGQAFIVMEHVEGKPLSQLIPSDGLSPVIRYGTQIADALGHQFAAVIERSDIGLMSDLVTTDAPDASSPSRNGRDDRLDSYKEIAAYLRRDVRTVMRWRKEGGLPVYSHHLDDTLIV